MLGADAKTVPALTTGLRDDSTCMRGTHGSCRRSASGIRAKRLPRRSAARLKRSDMISVRASCAVEATLRPRTCAVLSPLSTVAFSSCI